MPAAATLVTAPQGGYDTPSISALFTFVARDLLSGKATEINPLVPQTPEQEALQKERHDINLSRKAQRAANTWTAEGSPVGVLPWMPWMSGFPAVTNGGHQLLGLVKGSVLGYDRSLHKDWCL